MEELLNKLNTLGKKVEVNTCYGVYDTIISIKLSADPKNVGWMYLKEGKILLMHHKDKQFDDLDNFISYLKVQ
jgi:hypothetical protein